jgi:hypothetical protein
MLELIGYHWFAFSDALIDCAQLFYTMGFCEVNLCSGEFSTTLAALIEFSCGLHYRYMFNAFKLKGVAQRESSLFIYLSEKYKCQR